MNNRTQINKGFLGRNAMRLYLIRHADAKSEEEDPLRPLSESGMQDIKKVASYLSHIHIKIDQIFHSPKLRAKQTAEVLHENVKASKGISEVDELAPLDDPNIWIERLKGITDTTALVGHLPHLGKLITLLLCGNTNKDLFTFKPSGVACLQREDSGAWSLLWILIPEVVLLPKLAGFP
ncbi:MAG: phosphohistidine phosphatase SixA [wastewater metagenome]|nr:phosphohistidine phosphatase SixA [Candidatus Loosdrechtia aerotolerans]